MLLNQNEIVPKIKDVINENTKEVIISSAYIKYNLLKELEPTLRSKNVNIFVRWEVDDLIRGASDVEIYDLCQANNWRLYRNQRLHSKFILIDNSILIIGSSNYTYSGTGRNRENIERNFLSEISKSQANDLLSEYSFSTRINDTIYENLKTYIKENPLPEEYAKYNFDKTIFQDKAEEYIKAQFTFNQLPPFRPDDNSFDESNELHTSYLQVHGIISHHDYEALRNFIESNPISLLIIEFLNTRDTHRCQWGKAEKLIMGDERLFSSTNNNRGLLKSELSQDNRLFNLFCWLEYFRPNDFWVWNIEEYLNNPREGTCSLNRR